MNFDYSENQLLFRDSVERFLGDDTIASRRIQRATPGGIDRTRWMALADMGLLALGLDEDKGGLGGSIFDLAVVGEAMGTRLSADAWLENGVLPLLVLNATANADSDLIAALVSGEKCAAFAFAEAQTRFSMVPKSVVAKADGAGFSVQGEKQFVLGGMAADVLIVTALLDGETGCFLIGADNAGVHRRGYRLVDGSTAAIIELHVEDAIKLEISPADFANVITQMRLLVAAELTGLGKKMLDDTLVFVRQREQFGQAIGRFQALQHRLVDCYLLDDQNRSSLLRAGMHLTSGGDVAAKIAGTKALIAQNVLTIGEEAVQMHGGMGTTDEVEIGHAHKRALLLAQLFGDPASDLAAFAKAA